MKSLQKSHQKRHLMKVQKDLRKVLDLYRITLKFFYPEVADD